jgi:hypothetical protein
VKVLDFEDAGLKQITAFAVPALFARFGLPAELHRESD